MLDGLVGLRSHAGGEQVVVQDRRIRRHRRFDIDNERQHFVLHVDQLQRFIGDRLSRGGDGGDGVALIQRLAARHDVQRQVAEVHRAFAHETLLPRRLRGNPRR